MYDTIEQAIAAVVAGDAVLIDVRSKAEYKQQAAHMAINLDVSDIQTGHNPELTKDTRIVLYCRSGGRAGIARSILESRGYTNVQSIGGLNHWINAGGK